MISLENGSRKRRFGFKIREECSSQSCTASRRTSGVVKSPTVRNRTSAICVKRCGYRREGSPQSQHQEMEEDYKSKEARDEGIEKQSCQIELRGAHLELVYCNGKQVLCAYIMVHVT